MPGFGNSNMQKALIVNPFWDTFGGGERYTATFVKMLLDQGWSVDVLWHDNLSQPLLDHFGVDIATANWINQTYFQLSTFNYQLLYWLSDGSLPTSFAKKTIIHLQFPFTNIGGRRLANFIKSRFYTFMVNSNFTKSFIDSEYGVNSVVVHPPVDTGLFTPGKKTKTILYVGRFSSLTQKKGHDILIEAFAKLSPQLPHWKLILAGGTAVGTDPKDFEKLQSSAKNLRIEIISNPSLEKIRKLYSQAKIFWSASGFGANETSDPLHVEHFGISLVEAMAAGCVPIATDLGGHKEIITHGVDGFTWTTVKELIDYTSQVVANPQLCTQISQSAIFKSKMFNTQAFYEKALALVTTRATS